MIASRVLSRISFGISSETSSAILSSILSGIPIKFGLAIPSEIFILIPVGIPPKNSLMSPSGVSSGTLL